jgi:phosphate transport system substrate-binding protein
MKATMLKGLAAGAAVLVMAQPAMARDQIRAVGSSTVYPFTTTSAEQFGQGGKFKTPIIESTGTGGGFKLFCEGVGEDKPDINDASRKITDSEKETCAKNGVTDIVEVPIGYDGIVFASKKGVALQDLSKKQIFMALARWLPGADGKLAANTIQTWNQIDPKLPNQPIEVYGPPPTSGTRDAFAELVMEKGCEAFPEFAKTYPDEKERKKICHTLREDGKYIESGEDDNIIIQKLVSDDKAFGIFGYSYYDNNRSKIEANKIEGVAPDFASVESGKYGISRGLYIYVKKQQIGTVPGIVEFVRELTSEASIGANGYNTAKGLLPLKDADRKTLRTTVDSLAKK